MSADPKIAMTAIGFAASFLVEHRDGLEAIVDNACKWPSKAKERQARLAMAAEAFIDEVARVQAETIAEGRPEAGDEQLPLGFEAV